MLSECIFNGGRCETCGAMLPPGVPDTARQRCGVMPPPCPHLGPAIERDGVAVKVKCGCTKKDQERMLPVSKCAKYRRCLPTARFDTEQLAAWNDREESYLYRLCQTCPENKAELCPQ